MESLLVGLALGFSAGVSPGPLLALVISATLARGWRGGLQAAIAPLISDLPVIVLCITVVSVVPASFVAILSAVGAVVLLWFGVHGLREARHAVPPERTSMTAAAATSAPRDRTWLRAAVVNILSPSPWLFWATVGGPILVASWRQAPSSAAAFVLGFYLLLVGMKVVLAIALSATRHRLSQRAYRAILSASAVLMLVLAVLLAVNAVQVLQG